MPHPRDIGAIVFLLAAAGFAVFFAVEWLGKLLGLL
jgi:hypothetical protein